MMTQVVAWWQVHKINKVGADRLGSTPTKTRATKKDTKSWYSYEQDRRQKHLHSNDGGQAQTCKGRIGPDTSIDPSACTWWSRSLETRAPPHTRPHPVVSWVYCFNGKLSGRAFVRVRAGVWAGRPVRRRAWGIPVIIVVGPVFEADQVHPGRRGRFSLVCRDGRVRGDAGVVE